MIFKEVTGAIPSRSLASLPHSELTLFSFMFFTFTRRHSKGIAPLRLSKIIFSVPYETHIFDNDLVESVLCTVCSIFHHGVVAFTLHPSEIITRSRREEVNSFPLFVPLGITHIWVSLCIYFSYYCM